MGIFATLFSKVFKAEPFRSEVLDDLAERLKVTKILRREKIDRYYKARFLMQGGLASFDRVVFDAKYLEILLPDELEAVTAHEFTHLNQRHGRKRFWRLPMPALIIAVITVFLTYSSFGNYLLSILIGGVVTFCSMIVLLFLNAKWQRQQEMECDLSSVKIDKGEAMISALVKISSLRTKSSLDIKLSKSLPQSYPTFEERIKKNTGSTGRPKD